MGKITTTTTPRDQIVSCGIFVGCSPAMKAQLAVLARLEHRTLSGMIRLLIERRLARHDRTQRQP